MLCASKCFRRSLRGQCPALFLVAAALVLSAAGCGSDSTGDSGNAKKPVADKPLPPPPPLLKGWDKPAAALVFSGEAVGYLEPCGCSETQSGGMARRHELFQKLEAKGWPVAAFDLGGSVARNNRQSQLKFETILESLKVLGYDVMALGREELRFGPDFLLARQNLSPEAGEEPAFVVANLTLYSSPDLGPARSRVVEVGETKIGVTSIIGAGVREKLFPEGASTDVEISDPAAALETVLPELQAAEPDLLVLLSHAPVEESRELAKRFPDFDLVVTAGGPEDPDGKPERIGDTLLLKVGRKGKHVGVVGFYPDAPGERLRFELVQLDNRRFSDYSEKMRELMQIYQDQLRAFAPEVFLDLPHAAHPAGAAFTGAERCGKCHVKAYNKWKLSGHARATKSLVEGRKGQKDPVSRINDPECLSCHVTGWQPQEVGRYESGYLSELFFNEPDMLAAYAGGLKERGLDAELTADLFHKLQGQQCENCHGPGSEHSRLEEEYKRSPRSVSNDDLLAGRKAMNKSRAYAQKHLCTQCHDLDNSPNFNFDEYWDKIKHPWRD